MPTPWTSRSRWWLGAHREGSYLLRQNREQQPAGPRRENVGEPKAPVEGVISPCGAESWTACGASFGRSCVGLSRFSSFPRNPPYQSLSDELASLTGAHHQSVPPGFSGNIAERYPIRQGGARSSPNAVTGPRGGEESREISSGDWNSRPSSPRPPTLDTSASPFNAPAPGGNPRSNPPDSRCRRRPGSCCPGCPRPAAAGA